MHDLIKDALRFGSVGHPLPKLDCAAILCKLGILQEGGRICTVKREEKWERNTVTATTSLGSGVREKGKGQFKSISPS